MGLTAESLLANSPFSFLRLGDTQTFKFQGVKKIPPEGSHSLLNFIKGLKSRCLLCKKAWG